METAWLFAGLGNPGPQYAATRHNLGFMVADRLIELGASRKSMRLQKVESSADMELYRLSLARHTVWLVKPLTYMNLSGTAVARVAGRESVPARQVVVMHDELDLPLGRIKLKRGGGANGHNGVLSVMDELGTGDFLRLRLGIDRPEPPAPPRQWVLAPMTDEDIARADKVAEKAVKGLDLLLRRGMQDATQFLHTDPEAQRRKAQEKSEADPAPTGVEDGPASDPATAPSRPGGPDRQ